LFWPRDSGGSLAYGARPRLDAAQVRDGEGPIAIRILAYGSLVWDLDDLAPHVRGDWDLGAGPSVPIEFARVSLKRKRALALVIEPDHGADCITHAIDSVRADIHEAAADLARRERTTDIAHIGAVCLDTGFRRSSSDRIAARVAAWCEATGARGAVWTDLPTNFLQSTGAPFSVEAAVAYLQALRGESLEEAVRYIENAPAATDTPLRRRLAADPWWRSLAPLTTRSAPPIPPSARPSAP